MKIFISVLIVSMLVFIGAAGYHIYGISVPLKVSPISNESIVNDIEVLKPLPEKVVGVIEIPTPKEEPNDILEEIPDYELVSVEKYSTIKTSNYFKSNKIFVFNAQGFEEVFANTDDIYLKAGTLKKLIKVNDLKMYHKGGSSEPYQNYDFFYRWYRSQILFATNIFQRINLIN